MQAAAWGVWCSYEARLVALPLQTKMLTSLSLMTAGDIFAQTLDPSVKKWDPSRTASMACLGCFCHAPYFHAWYRWLDPRFKGTGMISSVLPKLALELTTAGPGYLVIVLAYSTFCRTGSLEAVKPKLEQDFAMVYGSGVAFHGVVQAINFRFVPSRQRILYDNCVGLVWKTFLTYYANKGNNTGNAQPNASSQRPSPK
jgi:protein Mpv17